MNVARRNKGFTIIELMIVITILGILSSLAYAAYTNYTRLADRAKAKSDVYEIAAILERAFTEDRAYNVVNLAGALAQFNSGSPQLYTYAVTQAANSYDVVADVLNSRDDYDLTIDERGEERFRQKDATTWQVNMAWDAIPDA